MFKFYFSMDAQRRNLLLAALPAIVTPPPAAAECIHITLSAILSLARLHPDPLLDIRHRLHENAVNIWEGRDVFFNFHPYSFFEVTDETPDTLMSVVRMFQDRHSTPYEHKLSLRNRVLLFFLWLRSYPSYHMLALMFDAYTTTTIKNEISSLIPVFHDSFAELVQWPRLAECRQMRYWPFLPNAVGAIDGSSIGRHPGYRVWVPGTWRYSGYLVPGGTLGT